MSPMLMDPNPSQQHAGLHHAVWQPQQEVTWPKARFKSILSQNCLIFLHLPIPFAFFWGKSRKSRKSFVSLNIVMAGKSTISLEFWIWISNKKIKAKMLYLLINQLRRDAFFVKSSSAMRKMTSFATDGAGVGLCNKNKIYHFLSI